MKLPKLSMALVCASSLQLVACGGGAGQGSTGPSGAVSGGGSSGSSSSSSSSSGSSSGSGFATPQAFFAANVEPNLGFCRSCHVPGGVADTAGASPATQGNLFLLSSDSSQDYDKLMTAWTNLGKGVTGNKLLTNPSDPAQNHTGGQPWPVTSQAYAAMQTLLSCWDNPSGCAALLGSSGGPVVRQAPLLGSSHARSYMDAYCEGRPDHAVLPQDPRELIRPGVNAGKAVAFNAWWQDCTGPGKNPLRKPASCGEYRSRRTQGEDLMRRGLALHIFGHGVVPAQSYNSMWSRWGLLSRPADFDAQVRERYGLPQAPYDNPYPLPREDPKATHGGSGQLPAGLVQIKAADDSYTGTIGITCDACHSGELKAGGVDGNDAAFVSGLGANTSDLQLLLSDTSAPLPLGLNSSRGVTNAEGLSGLLIGLLDIDSLGFRPDSGLISQIPGNTSGAGDTKMPAWWNSSRRPRKFWDGGLSYDAARLASAILYALVPVESPTGEDKAFNKILRDLIESQSLLAEAYIESLQSPPYPGPIDAALAEQGAILFHSKDLWAHGGNADIPRPPSNGSCAGCHGAYSPRFVNDPAYLADPRLEGIAGYIAPIDQIRTDAQRLKGFTPALLETMSTSWFSYPESSPGYVSPDAKNPVVERLDDYQVLTPGVRPKGACTWQGELPQDAVGYLAPPLHGVWATAPYLHNGSVPDLWTLLKPDARPAMWRRRQTAGPGTEHGPDTGLAAYDTAKLGWKYDVLACGAGGVPYLSCEPDHAQAELTTLVDFLNTFPGTLDSLGYLLIATPPLTRDQVEARKIFNSHQFGKSNTGHDFGQALTDDERKALIEYLKTL